jgi:hypothetical protein
MNGGRRLRLRAGAMGLAAGLTLILGGCAGGHARHSAAEDTLTDPPATGLPTALPPITVDTSAPTDLESLPPLDPGVTRPPRATSTKAPPPPSTGPAALQGTFVPAGFPFPPGSTYTVTARSGGATTVNVTGVPVAAANQYFRQKLPAIGYPFHQQRADGARVKATFYGAKLNIELLTDPQGNVVSLIFATRVGPSAPPAPGQ